MEAVRAVSNEDALFNEAGSDDLATKMRNDAGKRLGHEQKLVDLLTQAHATRELLYNARWRTDGSYADKQRDCMVSKT